MDFVSETRPVPLQLVAGRGHYERVIDAVRTAKHSVWIATANLKELMIERGEGLPARGRNRYESVLSLLARLVRRGVELRILHAALPSRAFRRAFDQHARLVRGGLQLRQCPRVHLKAVVIDGSLVYLGSANWTGAGLGAKAEGRRNFELGLVTSDEQTLDAVQEIFQTIWSGQACTGCGLRDSCEAPLDLR